MAGNEIWVDGAYYPLLVKTDKTRRDGLFEIPIEYEMSVYFCLCPSCSFKNANGEFEVASRDPPDCKVCGNHRVVPSTAIPCSRDKYFRPVKDGWIKAPRR